jgi:hypothetical protein
MYHTGSSVLDLAHQVMTIAVRIVIIRLVRVGCNLQDRTPLAPKPVDSAGRLCILKRNGRMHRQESGNPFYRKSVPGFLLPTDQTESVRIGRARRW